MTMEFPWKGRQVIIQGIESLELKRASLHRLHTMLQHDDVHGFYKLVVKSKKVEVVDKGLSKVLAE